MAKKAEGETVKAGPSKITKQTKPSVKEHVAKPALKRDKEKEKPEPRQARNVGPKLRREGKAEVLSSKIAYEGPLFKVFKEQVREPNGHVGNRDIIRHNGSVVILAVDERNKKTERDEKNQKTASVKKSKKDPLLIMERQYRHAAGQYLWELPAGKIEPGEQRLAGAKRELLEETGYTAARWTELVRYFASPGFLGEWMQVYLAEDLTAGTAQPEADETLEIYSLPLSQVEALIAEGKILDGKTLIGVSLYRQLRKARKAERKKKKVRSKID